MNRLSNKRVSSQKTTTKQRLKRKSFLLFSSSAAGMNEYQNISTLNPAFNKNSTKISSVKPNELSLIGSNVRDREFTKASRHVNEVGLYIHPEGYPCARRSLKKPVRCSDQLIGLVGGDPLHSVQLARTRIDYKINRSSLAGLESSPLKVVTLKEGILSIYNSQQQKNTPLTEHQGERLDEAKFEKLCSDGTLFLGEKVLIERISSISYNRKRSNTIGLRFTDEEDVKGYFKLSEKLQKSFTKAREKIKKRNSEMGNSTLSARNTVFSSFSRNKVSTETKQSLFSRSSVQSGKHRKSVESLLLSEDNSSNKTIWLHFIGENSAQSWLLDFLTEIRNQALLNEKYFFLYKEKLILTENKRESIKRVEKRESEVEDASTLHNIVQNMELVLRTAIDLFALSNECNQLRSELADFLLERGRKTISDCQTHEGQMWKKLSNRLINPSKMYEDSSKLSRGKKAADMSEMLLFLRDFVADEIHYSISAFDDAEYQEMIVEDQYSSLLEGNAPDMIKLSHAIFQRYGVVPPCFIMFLTFKRKSLLDKTRAVFQCN
eukprot:snap_masked-scaffold_38-processed-gene-2.47-mRNA-1 protein AED:1.00 eAED:1.00 QI:0/0/0/0/1/1/2/0/547